MGYMNIDNHFGIAHRAHATKNDYALLCSPDGDTDMNCEASASVVLRVGAGFPRLKINHDTTIIRSVYATIDASTTVIGGLTTDTLGVSGSLTAAGGVTVTGHILPTVDAMYRLGGSDAAFSDVYADDVHALNVGNSLAWLTLNAPLGVQMRYSSIMKLNIGYSVTTSYNPINEVSDARIKADVQDEADTHWDDFKQLRVASYRRLYPAAAVGKRRLGVIADEVEACSSEFLHSSVSVASGETVFDDGTALQDVKTVDYGQLYRMSMLIVQQLQRRVEALEARLDSG
jgi:hypothetical protein